MSETKASKKGFTEMPPMRLLHRAKSLKNVVVAVLLSSSVTGAVYFLNNRSRQNRYKEFYENYDPEASFTRMQMRNLLQCCPPPPPKGCVPRF